VTGVEGGLVRYYKLIVKALVISWLLQTKLKKELLTLREYLDSPPFFVGRIRVAHLLIFCVVFVLCLDSCVPSVACFSGLSILDCPFGFLQRLLKNGIGVKIYGRYARGWSNVNGLYI
jgi:hydrogenase-4 membrane subunit HyfE